MLYVCDAPGGATWFAFETQTEADAESTAMDHAVAKHFRQAHDAARRSYRPREGLASFERDIALKGHIANTMPIFLTLRDAEGDPFVTAMIPRDELGCGGPCLGAVVVGPSNSNPYLAHADAIAALAAHYGVELPPETSYPYGS